MASKNFASFTGDIVRGQAIGNHFGIATANIEPHKGKPELEEGVYIVSAFFEQKKYSGLMHFGPLKTFGREFAIEVHLLDVHENLYGESLEIQPLKYLREVRTFENADALYTQIENDIVKARKYFLRKNILELWKNITPEQQKHMTTQVIEKLQQNPDFQQASTIGAYKPIADREIDFLETAKNSFPEKTWLIPTWEDKLQFEETPEFLIVPGRAGDEQGNRLGQGGGFYDQYLPNFEGSTITFLPDFARTESLPLEKHDQPVGKIVFVLSTL